MPGQCFYCKLKGHVLKDFPNTKKGFKPHDDTPIAHIGAQHVKLDNEQPSQMVVISDEGKNIYPSKYERWRPIEKRHSLPTKIVEPQSAHVSVGRYDVVKILLLINRPK